MIHHFLSGGEIRPVLRHRTRDATGYQARMPGPPPRGDHTLTPGERSAAFRERRKAAAATGKPPVVVRYRKPADRRSKPQQWADATTALLDALDAY
jgi:hypothetical protein